MIDTVGFVSKLPHSLVEAFKSTLEEVRYADLADPCGGQLLMKTDDFHIEVTNQCHRRDRSGKQRKNYGL